jgi:2-polyprenyl-3-methyl-5-hydroxy-6-metoxy-1,4-benzoquinol methylase
LTEVRNGLIQDAVGWDVATWGRALDYWKQQTRVVTAGATALKVGAAANNGGLSLWLANSGLHVTWSGLEEPEPLARELHRAHHVDGSIRYEQIDVLDIPYKNAFDGVGCVRQFLTGRREPFLRMCEAA